MTRLHGYSFYCCEICNESYAYVHIIDDDGKVWVSSYINPDEGVGELREDIKEECLKRGIDVSKIEGFDTDSIGDWEYEEC
jgi:hypothetical protein